MSDCLFCRIAKKEIPAEIIYEDELAVAFDDIAPIAPIHKLIIPRQHIATLNELNEDNKAIIGHLYYVAKQIARQCEIDEKGYRVLMNCNEDGGQSVFHLHAHLIGGKRLNWP